ncbi:hypothetical protein NP570_25445 [Vibrio parahaemolyticus]|nr:hypothetical protein [Vibrio parahaemolyticus]
MKESQLAMEGFQIQCYRKEKREARKIGHINVRGDNQGDLHRRE